MAAAPTQNQYQPDLRIPQLPYPTVANPVDLDWWTLSYDPTTDKTYKIQLLEFARILRGGFFRTIPYADWNNERQDDYLVLGQYSTLVQRPNGSDADGYETYIGVKELGGGLYDPLAVEIPPETALGRAPVRAGFYDAGTDTFTPLGSLVATALTHAQAVTAAAASGLNPGGYYVLNTRPNGGINNERVFVRAVDESHFAPLAELERFGSYVAGFYSLGGDTFTGLAAAIDDRSFRSVTYANFLSDISDDYILKPGRLSYIYNRPNGIGAGGSVLTIAVREMEDKLREVPCHEITTLPLGGGQTIRYGVWDMDTDIFRPIELHNPNTDTGSNSPVWAWTGHVDNQDQEEIAYLETFARPGGGFVARRYLLQTAAGQPAARLEKCADYTGTGADVWEEIGGGSLRMNELTFAAFSALRTANAGAGQLRPGDFYKINDLPDFPVDDYPEVWLIVQALTPNTVNNLALFNQAGGGGVTRRIMSVPNGLVGQYDPELYAHQRNRDFETDASDWRWFYHESSQDQGGLYYVQSFVRPGGSMIAKRVRVQTDASTPSGFVEQICHEYTGNESVDVWEDYPAASDGGGGAASVRELTFEAFYRLTHRHTYWSVYFENGRFLDGEQININLYTLDAIGSALDNYAVDFTAVEDVSAVDPAAGQFVANTRLDAAHTNMAAARSLVKAIRASVLNEAFFAFVGVPGDGSRPAVYVVTREPALGDSATYEGRFSGDVSTNGQVAPGIGLSLSGDFLAEGDDAWEPLTPGQQYALYPEGESAAIDNPHVLRFQCLGAPFLLSEAFRLLSPGDELAEPGDELAGAQRQPVFFDWLNGTITPIPQDANLTIPSLDVVRQIYGYGDRGSTDNIPPLIGPPPMAQLKFRWFGGSPEFLKYNPEIWLYVWNNRARTWDAFVEGDPVTKRLRSASWKHPAHQNGVRYSESAFFGGARLFMDGNGNQIEMPGLDTEFVPDFLNWTQRKQHIQSFDLTNWFVKMDGDTGLPEPGNVNISSRKHRSIRVRFAIVIDAPPGYRGPYYGGKARGPWSDEFRIFARKAAYFNPGAPEYWFMIDKAL